MQDQRKGNIVSDDVSKALEKKKSISFRWYILGVFLLGLVIGYITGMSESPVAATVLPLLFGLISAGSGLYILKAEFNSEASILKFKLLAFSLVALSISTFTGSIYGICVRTGGTLRDFVITKKESDQPHNKISYMSGNLQQSVDMIVLRSKLEIAGATNSEIDTILSRMYNSRKYLGFAQHKDSLLNLAEIQVPNVIKQLNKLAFAKNDPKISDGDNEGETEFEEEDKIEKCKKNLESLHLDLVGILPIIGNWKVGKNEIDFSAKEQFREVAKDLNTLLADENTLTTLCKATRADIMAIKSVHVTFNELSFIAEQSLNTEFISENLDQFIKVLIGNESKPERRQLTTRPSIKP